MAQLSSAFLLFLLNKVLLNNSNQCFSTMLISFQQDDGVTNLKIVTNTDEAFSVMCRVEDWPVDYLINHDMFV